MALRYIKSVVALLFAGAVIIAVSPQAEATMVSWGDPFVGHSWDAAWSESSSASFNSLQATIYGPSSAIFEIPAIAGLPDSSSWVVGALSGDSKTITASGPSLQNLEFSTRFIGTANDYTPANQLFVDFRFKNNGNVVDEKFWAYDNVNGWMDPDPPNDPVPEGGATFLLLGLSSLGIAGFRKVVS